MAGLDKPFDILVQHGPPESLEKAFADDEDPFVAEIVVGLGQESESSVRGGDDLVGAVGSTSPKLIVAYEVPGG